MKIMSFEVTEAEKKRIEKVAEHLDTIPSELIY
jgi:hypothetical protein